MSSFGFLYNLKPTKTPVTGLMCSKPGSMYLQIVPSINPGMTNIQNDAVENMLFEIQLFYGRKIYLNGRINKNWRECEINWKKKAEFTCFQSEEKSRLNFSWKIKFYIKAKWCSSTRQWSTRTWVKTRWAISWNWAEPNIKMVRVHWPIIEELENTVNANAVNVWGLLAGREVAIQRVLDNQSQKIKSEDVFSCRLRKKNPFYEELYSLKFRFSSVMNESGYISNKTIM